MKTTYLDFIRKKLHLVDDNFLDKYNKFRMLPFQLMDMECKEVYEFIVECRNEYEQSRNKSGTKITNKDWRG